MIALGFRDKYKNRDNNRHQIRFTVQREALARMFSQQMKSYDGLIQIKKIKKKDNKLKFKGKSLMNKHSR